MHENLYQIILRGAGAVLVLYILYQSGRELGNDKQFC